MGNIDGSPTLEGFIVFIRTVMGITTGQLPDDAPVIPVALELALATVNQAITAVPPLYTIAVYNLAGDNLINYAPDVDGAPDVEGSEPPAPFFSWARKQLNINSFIPGVISASGDQGTNQALEVIEAAKRFTLGNLQNLKTVYGRRYLAIAQDYGPSVWGVS